MLYSKNPQRQGSGSAVPVRKYILETRFGSVVFKIYIFSFEQNNLYTNSIPFSVF